jgi:SAM-dependent methyltransferase
MITYQILPIIKRAIAATEISPDKIIMGELGNQYMDTGGTGKKYFKGFYEVREHISFDLNGLDGALPLDLGQRILGYDKHFDIVTDFGTSEHVYDQYWAFKNVYEFLKFGGIALHALPLKPYWPKHGNYSYDADFFFDLAQNFGYEIIFNGTIFIQHNGSKGLATAILKKKSNFHWEEGLDFYDFKGLYKEEL